MTYPSSADELIFDQTTMLVRNGAVKNDFGSVSIINLFSSIDNPLPKTDKTNTSFVMRECDNADVIRHRKLKRDVSLLWLTQKKTSLLIYHWPKPFGPTQNNLKSTLETSLLWNPI